MRRTADGTLPSRRIHTQRYCHKMWHRQQSARYDNHGTAGLVHQRAGTSQEAFWRVEDYERIPLPSAQRRNRWLKNITASAWRGSRHTCGIARGGNEDVLLRFEQPAFRPNAGGDEARQSALPAHQLPPGRAQPP